MQKPPHLSPVWKRYAEAARATGFATTESALRSGRSGDRLDALVRRLHHEFEHMTSQVFESLPGADLACTPGCDHCCHTLRVVVSPIEVLVIGRRLRDTREMGTLPAELVEDQIHRGEGNRQADGDREAVSDFGGRAAPTPCPLLLDRRCLVYSSRPLACRGCVSADAALCAAADDDHLVPRSTAHQLGAAALVAGVSAALNELGLVAEPVELRSGLRVAVADEDAVKRWLRGEDVFAQRHRGPSDPVS